jgi:hypothetical protein
MSTESQVLCPPGSAAIHEFIAELEHSSSKNWRPSDGPQDTNGSFLQNCYDDFDYIAVNYETHLLQINPICSLDTNIAVRTFGAQM